MGMPGCSAGAGAVVRSRDRIKENIEECGPGRGKVGGGVEAVTAPAEDLLRACSGLPKPFHASLWLMWLVLGLERPGAAEDG
jgi:hypothetical protein